MGADIKIVPVEDIILVEKTLKGDVGSFEEIVRKYQMSVLKFVYSMIREKEASEDITQEVFITVYNKLYLYNKKYSFFNWIIQIAKNKTIDYTRKYRKVFESDIDEAYNISSKDMGPDEVLEYREMRGSIQKYILSLDMVDREILSLRYSSNMTFKDIAEVLKLAEPTVKRRYYKIRDGFKNCCDK